jgi:hypothetical protein
MQQIYVKQCAVLGRAILCHRTMPRAKPPIPRPGKPGLIHLNKTERFRGFPALLAYFKCAGEKWGAPNVANVAECAECRTFWGVTSVTFQDM